MNKYTKPLLLPFLLLALITTVATQVRAQQPETTIRLEATQYKLSRLALGRTTDQAVFSIDPSNMVTIDIIASIGEVNTSILGPAGQILDPTTIGTFGGSFVMLEGTSEQEGAVILPSNSSGFHYIYSFPWLGAGNYTVRFQAPANLAQEVPIITQVTTDSAIHAKLFATAPVLFSGQPAVLSAAIFDGQTPIAGANVSVVIKPPTGSAMTISLHDDGGVADGAAGDGLYSGEFTPSGPGKYEALALISGTSGGIVFSRHSATEFSVVALTGRLTGMVQDQGVDDNSDGLFDRVAFDVQIQTSRAGKYRSFVHLKTAQGKKLVRSADADLSLGLQNIRIDFEASAFLQLGENGPYGIELVELIFLDKQGMTPADRLENVGQTRAYLLSQFQRPPLALTGIGSADGVDTNGNSLFDLLRVGIEINVRTGGTYNWSALLTDRDGREIGFASNSGSLQSGLNTLILNFNGETIGRNGVDGPYFVDSLLVFGPGGSLVVSRAFTTGPFQATQFEGGCNITCPANITRPNDLGQCGAIVNYMTPTTTGSCGTVTCSPPTGSFFPVGATTVSCTTSAGPSCSFTVMIQDTEQPKITCPTNVTAVTQRPGDTSVVVNFSTPTISDNCPGVTVSCSPASGSAFPVGTTTVTCKANDAAGNMATCAFTVTVFDVRLQDDSNPSAVLLFMSSGTETGKYRFCYGGNMYSGIGAVSRKGSVFTLTHNPSDRRVLGRVDAAVNSGTASIQFPPGSTIGTITDRDIRNDTSICP